MNKLSIFTDPIDAAAELTLDNGMFAKGYADTFNGRPCTSFDIDNSAPNGHGCTLKITHVGRTLLLQRSILWLKVPGFEYPWQPNQTAALASDDFYLQSGFPVNPPTRLEVLQVNTHFLGGLIVDSPVYGKMPWWPSALTWCDATTRRIAYDESRVAGDTHQILHIPNGKPLYNSPTANNFYNPSRFPALDWTNGMSHLDGRFTEMVDEIIQAGFKIVITMDEEYPYSIQIVRMVMEALRPEQVPYCVTLPGYDGVFYGWEPAQTLIPGWAALARSIQPNCMLGIEFNPGHIPFGHGTADYAPNGLMKDFDCLFGEFPTVPPDLSNPDDCDNVWHVVGRTVRPYNRPPEQPADNDPRPPFYLIDSVRGPRTFIAFETWNPYNWVRINPNDPNQVAAARAQIQSERNYFKKLGCQYIG